MAFYVINNDNFHAFLNFFKSIYYLLIINVLGNNSLSKRTSQSLNLRIYKLKILNFFNFVTPVNNRVGEKTYYGYNNALKVP